MQETGQGKEDEEDYLFMLKRAKKKDSENFPRILTNLTPNQMEQIQKNLADGAIYCYSTINAKIK